MEILNVFAMVGILINDLVAIFSVLGSTILLFGAFSKAPLKRYGQIANWSITGLTFGLLFQISMAVTGTTPEQIGFMMPMSALMVNALLGVSMLMLGGRWMIRRTLQRG
jgi:hypothetical protein